jgi:hypothetical protein
MLTEAEKLCYTFNLVIIRGVQFLARLVNRIDIALLS